MGCNGVFTSKSPNKHGQTQIESQLVNPKIDVWPLVYWSREPFPLAISTIFGRIPPMIKSTTWLNRSQPVGTLISLVQSSSQTGSRVWRQTCGGNPWLGTPRKFWYRSGSPKFQQSHHVIWSGYGVSQSLSTLQVISNWASELGFDMFWPMM